jgi:hypothetical protein
MLSSVEGESRMDIMTEPSFTSGLAATEGGTTSDGGPVVSEPFTVAYPVEFFTHKAGLVHCGQSRS